MNDALVPKEGALLDVLIVKLLCTARMEGRGGAWIISMDAPKTPSVGCCHLLEFATVKQQVLV